MAEHNHAEAHLDEKHIGRPPASALIRKALTQSRVLGVRIIGHPGAGKTELIEATLKRVPAPQRVGVVVVNPAAGRDAERLAKYCGFVTHINAAVPDPGLIWKAISEMKLSDFDTLLIEGAGGLAPLHDLGQDATVAAFSVSGGDDKAAEYHTLLQSATVVVLTKVDLRHLVKFDAEVFRKDVKAINPTADVHEVSAMTGFGMPEWLGCLALMRASKARSRAINEGREWTSDRFIG
ncbi:MAG TPA: GTP-binding protein [Tepidisphaeraceae bacterium]|nr:GTP-binding protein [Tepidisphaeraceae bacterium]